MSTAAFTVSCIALAAALAALWYAHTGLPRQGDEADTGQPGAEPASGPIAPLATGVGDLPRWGNVRRIDRDEQAG